jgi:peptide/nickel transport system permease protein
MTDQQLSPHNSLMEQELDRLPDTPFLRAWRRFRSNIPAMIGLALLALLLLLSAAAPLLTEYEPMKQNLSEALQTPSAEHLLGTDYLGRDLFTRLAYGGRLSLTIGFLAVAIGLLIGVPLGAVSGYYGGWPDMIIQRIADIFLSFPSFLLALLLVALMGVGVRNVILSVGILAIPSFIRLVRGSVLVIREQEYVVAARALGARDRRIIFNHILPNAMTPVIINASLNLGYALTTAAGLGFLGLGVQPPTPEWGMMLGEAKNYIFSHAYMVTYPGLIIFIAIVGLNLVGDALRDALDPRLRSTR